MKKNVCEGLAMMGKRGRIESVAMLLSLLLGAGAAWGHSQMLYTPQGVVAGAEIPLQLVFCHPYRGGRAMSMGTGKDGAVSAPLAFGVMTQRGAEEPVVTDLLDRLNEMTFTTFENEATGYEAVYRARGMGDFVFFLDPAPYYERGRYIRQTAKTIVNRGGMLTCVFDDVPGLPTQIRPLVRPYGLWVGSLFRGQVVRWNEELGLNEPVPHAEVEVELLNYDVDMEARAFVGRESPKLVYPHETLGGAQIIRANAHGEFSFVIPRAGWWGFAAEDSGGEGLEHNGKPLELGTVIWCYAVDL